MISRGKSMLPTFPEHCRVVVARVPFESVRVGENEGDIIATRLRGVVVTHRAVARLADGTLVTRGDNNPAADGVRTTAVNFVGVVVAMESPGKETEVLEVGAREVGVVRVARELK